MIAQKYGADSVTIHLREDRRHIRDNDLKIFVKKIRIPINLEIAPTKEMLKIGSDFPNITLTDIENNKITIPNDINTKYCVLLFFRGAW